MLNSILTAGLDLIMGSLGPWIAGGVAAIIGLFIARRSGANAQKIKQDAQRAKDQNAARRVDQKNSAKSDDQIRKDASKWTKS